ncbi:MAG: hypothetical protein HC890_09110 [Chloroflexaceae bacterium]|nr:hypothetical protein [Chloroflexaceae bacterium]
MGRKQTGRAWGRVLAVGAGTLAAGLAWISWVLPQDYGSSMTEWIRLQGTAMELVAPVFQALAAWVAMVALLPVEAEALPVVIVSGVAMLGFFLWMIPLCRQGLRWSWQQSSSQLATKLLVGFVGGAIFCFCDRYGLRIDLTRGARYSFVYFRGGFGGGGQFKCLLSG